MDEQDDDSKSLDDDEKLQSEISQFDFVDEVICLLQNESQTKFKINHKTSFITAFIIFLDSLFAKHDKLLSSFIWFVAKMLYETKSVCTKLELEVHTQIFQFVLSKIGIMNDDENAMQILYFCIMNHVINDKKKLLKQSNTRMNTKIFKFSLFDTVRIHSLKQRQEYNGQTAVILNYYPSKQRYHVQFDEINILLKPQSLTKVEEDDKKILTDDRNLKLFAEYMIKQKTNDLCSAYDEQWKNRQILINFDSHLYKIPFHFQIFGVEPKDGRRLFISLHGGGGCPQEVNDQQYKNQQHLYDDTMKNLEGVYLALRAPTNTWDLWHQPQIDECIYVFIQLCSIKLNVNKNKVCILGYSAGGDGVYRIGTRLANKFAAVSMMAGHPGNCTPFNLCNTPFAIHVGENDDGYDRNKMAIKWKQQFEELEYGHCKAVIHKGKGHWMDKEDAVALSWMSQFERNSIPKRIKWRQENVENTEFYWLSVEKELIEKNGEIEVCLNSEENCIDIYKNYAKKLNIHINQMMVNMDKSVKIRYKDKIIFDEMVIQDSLICGMLINGLVMKIDCFVWH